MTTDLLDKPDHTAPEAEKRAEARNDGPVHYDQLMEADEDAISVKLEENKRKLESYLDLGNTFDVVFREMEFGGVKTGLLYMNGFAKDNMLTEILKRLSFVEKEQLRPDAFKQMLTEYIPHIQVVREDSFKKAALAVMSGSSALFVEGEPAAMVIDAKSYPMRGLDEPTTEKVVRGAKDGFVETLLTNVTLMRRRIRDPQLRLEMMRAGERTQTDICVAYIGDLADLELVKSVKEKIKSVNVDGMPLGDKQLEEAIVGKKWNPYPVVRYTERPDVVASHLLEGHVVLFVDTSPSVIILPATMFHHVQHAEEFRQTPFIGTYLRWIRFFGLFASLFMLPLWFLMVIAPETKPAFLHFIGPDKPGQLPILAQFLLVEIGVDLMRMASVHTPTPLANAMGLISAILIGDIAVQTGLFVNEVILYMAVAAIGMFATPSYELGLANRIVRLGLLVAVGIFKIPGLVLGTTLLVVYLTLHRSYNSPYLWPLIPFNAKAMAGIVLRRPFLSNKMRPSITKPQETRRMPE